MIELVSGTRRQAASRKEGMTLEHRADADSSREPRCRLLTLPPMVTLLSVLLSGVSDLELTIHEDTKVDATVAATEVDGGSLVYVLQRRPVHGQATVDRATGVVGYTPTKDFNGDDAFSVERSDGRRSSRTEVKVHVAKVNDAPVARPLPLAALEDTAVRGVVSARDVDGDGLAFRVKTPPAHGTASVEPKLGAVTYQSARDFHGADAFVVEVSDGSLVATSDVTVTVTPVNDAPVAVSATFTLDEDTRLDALVSASDVDGDALTFRLVDRPKHGAATLDAATGALVYLPVRDFAGDDSCSVDVSDGRLKATAVVSLHVNPVNDAPTIVPLALTTREDTPVKGTIVAHDVDSTPTFKVSAPPGHGEAQVDSASGAVTYRPSPDFNGADAFTVEVSDGALTASALVSVTVAKVNDAPVLAPAAFSLDEDTRLDGVLSARDVDGDALTFRLAGKPAHGAATIEPATGTIGYLPAKDFFGEDSVPVEVSDGQLKATGAVTITVRPVNDAPVALPLALSTIEDTPVRGTIVATDVDSPLSYRLVARPQHGDAWVEPSGVVTYKPAPNLNGADAFTVEVTDGELSTKAEVTVTVAPVNDAPVVQSVTFSLDEDTPFEALVPSSDVDGDPLTARLSGKAAHGVATIDPGTGKLGYLPAKDYHGDDSVPVEVTDGRLKASATVTITVRPVNDAPVASPLALSTNEDQSVSGTIVASDVDHDALSYHLGTPPAHGDAIIDAKTGVVRYTPAPNTNGPDAFAVDVSDGQLGGSVPVSVAVAAVDDPPEVHPATLETPEDTVAEGKLPATEVDGERLVFRLVSAPRLGTATLLDAATGAWRFVPGANLNGEDELRFDASDGKTKIAGVVKLKVAPVNDAPTVERLELKTLEDHAVEGQLEGKDVDGDALTYSIASAPATGRAVMLDAARGRVRFEPARDFHGEASFTVAATDGKLRSAPALVVISVEAVNDAPVASDARLTSDEDELVHGTLGGADIDGDPLVFRIISRPMHGKVTISDPASGDFDYSPAPNYSGPDCFGFRVTDPSMAASTGKVWFTIKPVNDPPVAMTETISVPFRGMLTGRLKGYDRESKTLEFRVVGKPAHGQFRLLDARTGEFSYSTDGTSSTGSSVFFVVSDGELTSEPAELTIQMQNM